jgi:hypothetical protein
MQELLKMLINEQCLFKSEDRTLISNGFYNTVFEWQAISYNSLYFRFERIQDFLTAELNISFPSIS